MDPKSTKTILALALFALSATAYGFFLETELLAFQAALKAVPVATLALLSLGLAGHRRWMLAGFALSVLGDLMLAPYFDQFVPGLAFFLLAHLCYTWAFWRESPGPAWPAALAFYGFGAGMYAFLWPGLGAMALPVAVYVAAIMTMAWRASALLGRSAAAGFALAGALLFAGSDSLIALVRFHWAEPPAWLGFAIIYSYWLAQLLLWRWAAAAPKGQG